ncbi:hypothetical protein [Microbacterium sp. SORGH_AS_0888]|uniref:hypothetical protein n=1 Tax=Microbacterium sp. SORGH_AS_0888 TaxID=3041791 RepID=UPI0027D85D61|nr:hypothetical protein [Microbacterium sp. SORGH_AS_0888]
MPAMQGKPFFLWGVMVRSSAGEALRKRISRVVDWDDRELEVLALAVAQADDIQKLEALLADQGLLVVGSQGQVRMNPLITEIRLQRAQLGKYLAELRIPSDDDVAKDPKKQRAAEAMHAKRVSSKSEPRLRVVSG